MKNICPKFLMTVVALLMISAPAQAQKKDNGNESSAQQPYMFQTALALKADDIKIKSVDGTESSNLSAQETVAGLPDVKSLDKRPEAKGVRPGPAPPSRLRIVTETPNR